MVQKSFTVGYNTIDLTTKDFNSQNKACLVDRKLVDLLLKQIISIPFEEAKKAILDHMDAATTFEEMKTSFEESIYIHEVCTILTEAEVQRELVAG